MPYLRYWESKQTGVLYLSFGTGDLLLEGLRDVCRRANVHTGVLMTGIGSLSFGRIHSVVTNDVPPRDLFLDLPGPLEVVGFRGIIANHEPHVHISLMDKDGKFYGGHLEEGCTILTLSEVSILRTPDIRLTRRKRDGSPYQLIDLE